MTSRPGLKPSACTGTNPRPRPTTAPSLFCCFCLAISDSFPNDREAATLLDDAAHHVGNWIEEVPAWYDWTRDIFLSYWIGTRTVGGAHGDRELAEHFRFLHIALAAWRVTGEARYRDWALRYGRKRAERLLAADEPMPVLWDLDGRGLQPEDLQTRAEQGMAGRQPPHRRRPARWY